jgi:glutaredoxin-related protein
MHTCTHLSGFSDTATRILNVLSTPYETVDVLADEYIRYGIKLYSSWPTIPQVPSAYIRQRVHTVHSF